MRQNAKKVLTSFDAGLAADEKTISTNGRELFSYGMMIARKANNKVEVIDYEASPSKTTTTQIHAALVYFGNRVVRVKEF